MGSVIFFIIIIAVVLSALSKQKQQKNGKTNQQDGYAGESASRGRPNSGSSHSRTNSGSSYSSTDSSYSYGKNSSGSSYGRSSTAGSSMKNKAGSGNAAGGGSYATRKAAEHARENMKEQELKSRPTAQEFKEMAGVEASDGAILSAAKMHSFATELSNEFDSKEDLMQPVFDLMVKGPDTSIPNERDFVSEATDMLNSYVMES